MENNFNKKFFDLEILEKGYSFKKDYLGNYFYKKTKKREYILRDLEYSRFFFKIISPNLKDFNYSLVTDRKSEYYLHESNYLKRIAFKATYPQNIYYLEISKIHNIVYQSTRTNSIKFILD